MCWGTECVACYAALRTLSTTLQCVSLQNENVRFEQSRNVRFHRWPGAPWKRSESP